MKIVVTMKHTLESHTTAEIIEISMTEMNDIPHHLLLNVVGMNVLMSVMEEAIHLRLSTEENIETMIDLMIEIVNMNAITEITMKEHIIHLLHHLLHQEKEMYMSVKY